MALREASIRLTLRSGAFQSDMRRLSSQVATSGRRMGTALRTPIVTGLSASRRSLVSFGRTMGGVLRGPIAAGVTASKASLAELGSGLKGHIKTAATLGGVLSLGAAIKGAIDAETQYVRLAESMSSFGDRAVGAAEIQERIERAANRTKSAISDLIPLANQLSALGPEQMEEALSRASLQAKRLGVESSIVARTYTRLIAKGVADSVKDAERLTEEMNRFGRTVLGIDPDEAIDPMDVAEYASFVRSTNSSVVEMNALLAKTGSTAKDLGQAIEVIEELGLVLQTGKGLKELRKEARLGKNDINLEKNAIENLFVVLEKRGVKGFKALQKQFGTDRARKAIQEIIGEDIVVKAETGKITRKEWELRVGALRSELEKARTATFDWGRIAAANERITSTSGAKMQEALNKMTSAFATPEMLSSIERLSKSLPPLADKFVELLAWVTENPWKAAAIGVGGRAAIPFAGAAARSAIATAAPKAATTAISAMSLAAKRNIGFLAGFGSKAAAATGALGVLAAGFVGFKIGDLIREATIDKEMKKDFGKIRSVDETMLNVDRALRGKDITAKRAALEQVRAQAAAVKEGPTGTTAFVGSVVKTYGIDRLMGDEVKSAEAALADQSLKLTDAEIRLTREIEKMERQAGRAASALKVLSDAVPPPGTGRGIKAPANSAPGAAPVEG